MKRLLEDDSLPTRAAALLRAAAADAPPSPDAAKARLLTTVPKGAASREPRGGLRSRPWLALLVIAPVVIGASWYVHDGAPAPSVAPRAVAVAAPAEPPATAAAQPQGPASISVADLPSAKAAIEPSAVKSRAAMTPAPTAESTASAPRLEDELAALDEARGAFVGHQPSLALERVASYRRRFPAGHFTGETDALEIQALAALGRDEEARAKAARFLEADPASPYAQRVRSAVGMKP